MAFGFFKKNETADIIFMGGRVFTMNYDFPEVEAVACRDGIILDIGSYEDLSVLEGKNTEIVDLEGGVLLPGYIDTCGNPALLAMKNFCLFLKEGGPADIADQISGYAAANPDSEVIFAYGYDESVFENMEGESSREMLDKACADRPVVALSRSGYHCIINSEALKIVKAAAEEDEVQAVTIPYLLGVLEPVDHEAVSGAALSHMGKYCERGFTSVFDRGAPEYFSSVYQNILVNIYQENMLKQKYYGSLLISRSAIPAAVTRRLSQLRTNCAELNGYINLKTLSLAVEGSRENMTIPGEVLKELAVESSDKGFDVHIEARGEDAVSAAFKALAAARTAGYKKNALTLVHSPVDDADELSDNCYHMGITEIIRTPGSNDASYPDADWLCIANAKTVEEAVDLLTVDAAAQLGISGGYGTIERGKHADFVIFNENPFEAKSLEEFKKLKAVMTVIDGVVVYDAEEDDPSTWSLTPDETLD